MTILRKSIKLYIQKFYGNGVARFSDGRYGCELELVHQPKGNGKRLERRQRRRGNFFE